MTQGQKSERTNKPIRPESAVATGPNAQGWPTVNKVYRERMKISAGRKIPSGPVGGNGRKTNLSRSS